MKMTHNVEYVKRNLNQALQFCTSGLESGLVESVYFEFTTWRKEKNSKTLCLCILADDNEVGKISYSYDYKHLPTYKVRNFSGSISSSVFPNWIKNNLLISSGLKVEDLIKFEMRYESTISL